MMKQPITQEKFIDFGNIIQKELFIFSDKLHRNSGIPHLAVPLFNV
jgi:ureidoglycolate hydrolase